MKLYLCFLRYSPYLLMLAILVGSIAGVTAAALIALTNSAVTDYGHLTAGIALRFVGLVFVLLLSNYLSRILILYAATRLMLDLRLLFCRQLVRRPLRELEESGNHSILATLTEDVANISEAFRILPTFCINCAVLIACVIYLTSLSGSMLILAATYLGFILLTCLGPEVRAKRLLDSARDHWNQVVKHFQAMTEGMMQLKLHQPRCEAFLHGPLAESAASHWRYTLRGNHIYVLIASWVEAQYFILFGITVIGLTHFGAISSANLFAYALTVLYLRTPVMILMEILPSMARGRVSLERAEKMGLELGELRIASRSRRDQPLPASPFQCIELKQVLHRYYREKEGREFVLGPIDLTIHAGELILMIGSNGSGKTTLAKLLTGLYTPEAGSICMDGELVTEETLERYQQSFTAVFSEYYLFECLLGLSTVDQDRDAAARDLLVQFELDHKVKIVNGALSTTELSRGQRKRLALLNAYLEDRQFYVFDEWASDQDPAFREVFYRQCLPDLKARGKTILVVSHDDRYFDVADRVLRIEFGSITEIDPETVVADRMVQSGTMPFH
jgi:putative ATP-binding cassette transporter